jgi:hypothetical protein
MNQNDESKVKTPSQPAPVARTPQQAGDTPDPWWWVERSVWTERMLTRLTSGESADRVWFRMADKTYAPANLASAFKKVWKNGGSAGADEQTVEHFARHAPEELSRLAGQMQDGTYRPQPVQMVCAPWAAQLGSRTCVDADNRKTTNPLTGKPDAGEPPVRFGGRGGANPPSLPLSRRAGSADWKSAVSDVTEENGASTKTRSFTPARFSRKSGLRNAWVRPHY